jgi:hypothetical protein
LPLCWNHLRSVLLVRYWDGDRRIYRKPLKSGQLRSSALRRVLKLFRAMLRRWREFRPLLRGQGSYSLGMMGRWGSACGWQQVRNFGPPGADLSLGLRNSELFLGSPLSDRDKFFIRPSDQPTGLGARIEKGAGAGQSTMDALQRALEAAGVERLGRPRPPPVPNRQPLGPLRPARRTSKKKE